MQGKIKRRLLMAGGGVVVLFAASACVSNPGEFTIAVRDGSTLTFTNMGGAPTASFTTMPPCQDGVDNDLDGQIDTSDAQCGSAVDANERLSGVQPYTEATIPINIDGAGAISGDPTELTSQQIEMCVNLSGIQCIGITMTGVGETQSGTIGEDQISIMGPLQFELDALVGFSGLSSTCHIGPVNATFVADSYDTVTGEAMLEALDQSVPAVSGCGGSYDALINGFLSLPGQADIVVDSTILNGEGDPVQFDE